MSPAAYASETKKYTLKVWMANTLRVGCIIRLKIKQLFYRKLTRFQRLFMYS